MTRLKPRERKNIESNDEVPTNRQRSRDRKVSSRQRRTSPRIAQVMPSPSPNSKPKPRIRESIASNYQRPKERQTSQDLNVSSQQRQPSLRKAQVMPSLSINSLTRTKKSKRKSMGSNDELPKKRHRSHCLRSLGYIHKPSVDGMSMRLPRSGVTTREMLQQHRETGPGEDIVAKTSTEKDPQQAAPRRVRAWRELLDLHNAEAVKNVLQNDYCASHTRGDRARSLAFQCAISIERTGSASTKSKSMLASSPATNRSQELRSLKNDKLKPTRASSALSPRVDQNAKTFANDVDAPHVEPKQSFVPSVHTPSHHCRADQSDYPDIQQIVKITRPQFIPGPTARLVDSECTISTPRGCRSNVENASKQPNATAQANSKQTKLSPSTDENFRKRELPLAPKGIKRRPLSVSDQCRASSVDSAASATQPPTRNTYSTYAGDGVGYIQHFDTETKSWGQRKLLHATNRSTIACGPGICQKKIELARGGSVRIFRGLLQSELVEAMKDELFTIGKEMFRTYPIHAGAEPRLHFLLHEDATEDFGAAQPGYSYRPVIMKSRPLRLSPILHEQSKRFAELCSVRSWNIGINPVFYRCGRDKIGYHADDTQGEQNVFTVILKSPDKPRTLVVKPKIDKCSTDNAEFRETDERIVLHLQAGDGYEMDGDMQQHYVHSVSSNASVGRDSQRLVVVFRAGEKHEVQVDSGKPALNLEPRPPGLPHRIGQIPGIEEGNVYRRGRLLATGAHLSVQGGISGTFAFGCDSIIVSGKDCCEVSDHDKLNSFWYMAQKNNGARNIAKTHEDGLPIRVFRSSTYRRSDLRAHGAGKSPIYRYDGLYRVVREHVNESNTIYLFGLERVGNCLTFSSDDLHHNRKANGGYRDCCLALKTISESARTLDSCSGLGQDAPIDVDTVSPSAPTKQIVARASGRTLTLASAQISPYLLKVAHVALMISCTGCPEIPTPRDPSGEKSVSNWERTSFQNIRGRATSSPKAQCLAETVMPSPPLPLVLVAQLSKKLGDEYAKAAPPAALRVHSGRPVGRESVPATPDIARRQNTVIIIGSPR